MRKQAMAMEFVIGMIILIVALITIILIYRSTLTDSGESLRQTQYDAFNDCDNDGVPNIRDRCCGTPTGDEVDLTGCSGRNDEQHTCCAKK